MLGTGDVNPDGSTTIFGGDEGLKYSGATPADTRFLATETGEDNEGDRVRRMPFSLSKLDAFANRGRRAGAGQGLPRRRRARTR